MFSLALIRRIALALTLTLTSAASPAPSPASEDRALALLDTGWVQLAHGDAHEALRAFNNALPKWRTRQSDGRGYEDSERGIIIAALLAREDSQAITMLEKVRRESGGISPGTAEIFAGHWQAGLRTYLASTVFTPFGSGTDPVIAAGVHAAESGNWNAAIAVWSKKRDRAKSGRFLDLQTALIGFARAQHGDWNGAASAWIAAARQNRAVPDWESLEYGNIVALEMLVHFRDRYRRGDHRYMRAITIQ